MLTVVAVRGGGLVEGVGDWRGLEVVLAVVSFGEGVGEVGRKREYPDCRGKGWTLGDSILCVRLIMIKSRGGRCGVIVNQGFGKSRWSCGKRVKRIALRR